ncbi:uncharacterized protein LOC114720789 [Neltuma alba]|uniref:uncharacterized protein LOC114720789 n=1 Tax=Neltuma alba TaxID=207710 RepID=UPI0010A4EBFD|nr:uncharacterized protein LOC114720789 [Prosopis alba]XP_028762320.1 uncharacterized protein LOC114720789 [Prosopis alba]XP_028762321.1 uncharacterized protein LOC114720789 [Prosopis alba]
MDVLCLNDGRQGIQGKSFERSPSSGSSDMDAKFGDPEELPRVGDQYQAEIPPLVTSPCSSQLINEFTDSEVMVNGPESLGLPIPLMRAYSKAERCREALESFISEEGKVGSQNDCDRFKVEPQTDFLGEGKNVTGVLSFQSSFKCDDMGTDSFLELKIKLDGAQDTYLIPESRVESWTAIEYDSFLLGLYVFGKNFNFVKRFVGSKKTGHILSFYYGKFYRSDSFRRWSDCRKLRNKRCTCGQKIFTGWRQQELLSRLFSHVSRECQNTLVELSRNFVEGKMPFQEYVFALKNTVGVGMLIDAVGIGKGKHDLTGTAVEPTKINHVFSIHREIPIGKACSTLSSADIIKFLTGGFRLSKARSSDLFWEAVWPRLLAKGWRSEKPKDYIPSGSKQSLVFLTPGVKKFSRWKLVKGNHYFDSVSDVLNKVASDPGLLENEIEGAEGRVNGENGQDRDKQDPFGLLNKQQHRYLQPLNSTCSQIKFTIVDTSIAYDLEQRKVRELRSLPFEASNISTSISHSSCESEQDTSEETEGQSDQTNSSSPAVEFADKGTSVESKDCTPISEAPNADELVVEYHKCGSDLHNQDHSEENNDFSSIQKVSSSCTSRPMNLEELRHWSESTPTGRKLDLNEPTSPPNMCDASEGLFLSVDLQNMSSPSSPVKGSPSGSNAGVATQKHLEGEECAEKPKTRMLIDLNLPHFPPELGTDMEIEIPSFVVELQNNDIQCASSSSSSYEKTQLNQIEKLPDVHKEQQPNIVNRRQSTRNRPLSTKALEALEYGLLNSKRKRRNVEYSYNSSKSQCLRASGETTVSITSNNGTGNVMAEEVNELQAHSTSSLSSEARYNI